MGKRIAGINSDLLALMLQTLLQIVENFEFEHETDHFRTACQQTSDNFERTPHQSTIFLPQKGNNSLIKPSLYDFLHLIRSSFFPHAVHTYRTQNVRSPFEVAKTILLYETAQQKYTLLNFLVLRQRITSQQIGDCPRCFLCEFEVWKLINCCN